MNDFVDIGDTDFMPVAPGFFVYINDGDKSIAVPVIGWIVAGGGWCPVIYHEGRAIACRAQQIGVITGRFDG